MTEVQKKKKSVTKNKTDNTTKTTKIKSTKPRKPKSKLIVTHPIEDIQEGGWETKHNYNQKDITKMISDMREVIDSYLANKFKLYEVVPTSERSSKIIGGDYPTLEDLLAKNDISSSRFFEILRGEAKQYDSSQIEQLSHTYEIFKTIQKAILQKGALKGVIEPGFARFVLSVNHGMKSVEAIEIESNNKTTITGKVDVFAELDAIYSKELDRLSKQKEEMKERKARLDLVGNDEDEDFD